MRLFSGLDLSLLIIYYLGLIALYVLPFHHTYAPIRFNLIDILIALPFLISGLLALRALRDLSAISIFVLTYLFLVYFPFFLFFSTKVHAHLTITNALLVALPVLVVYFQGKIKFKKFKNLGFYNENTLDYILIIVVVISAILTLFFSPISSSLSLSDSYDRRLEARAIYTGGLAYLNEMVMNGLIPIMAFRSFYKKNYLFSALTIILTFIFYYSYGVKSPLVVMILAFLCGFLAEKKQASKAIKIFEVGIIVLIVVGYAEYLLNGTSNIIIYWFRRLHYVMAYNIQTYLDCFSSSNFSPLGLWGMDVKMPASMYVGEVFLQSSGLNANANTFMYYLIQFGLPGYLFSILSIWTILIFFDSWKDKSPVKSVIAGLFCLLVMEKSFTTSLVSSGILMLMILYFFSGKDSDEKQIP